MRVVVVVVVVFTKFLTRNYGLQASTVFSVQARGRNQRDGLGWGLVRKDEVSWAVDLFLHAEPRGRVVAASCCMEFWMAALVAAMGRLGPCV